MGYKDPNKKREYQRLWIESRRNEWLVENGPCVLCGSWDSLEVDHVDRSKKVLPPSRLWSLSRSNPVRIEELKKCQVLCRDCHRAKTAKELSLPCEDHKAAKHGCKCSKCKAYKRNWTRQYRARIRAAIAQSGRAAAL